MKLSSVLIGLLAATTAVGAHATAINFEDQPAGPCCFSTAGPAQTLVYSGATTATFTGGVILTGESSQTTDNSNVYATAYFGDPSLSNPLTITFSNTIQNFSMQILNALAGNYEVYDNNGNSNFFSLATTGGSVQTVGFAATGSIVNIVYLDDTQQDFAIDNITFDQPLPGVPEPASWAMMLAGFGAIGAAMRSRPRAAVSFG